MAAGATAAYAASNASAAASYTMGAIYTTLPAGCATPEVQGQTYYLCGNTWFSPSYGANGIFYRVVPVPWRLAWPIGRDDRDHWVPFQFT